MCYICKLRLQKLLAKGYIFDAQIAEVTEEVKKDFDKAMNDACDKMSPTESSAVIATLINGMNVNAEDYLKTTVNKNPNMPTEFGMSDDLLDQVLKNYDPKKAN